MADKVDTYRPVRQNSHPHPNYHSPCTNWLSLWPSGELGGTAHTPRSRRSSSVTKQSCPHCHKDRRQRRRGARAEGANDTLGGAPEISGKNAGPATSKRERGKTSGWGRGSRVRRAGPWLLLSTGVPGSLPSSLRCVEPPRAASLSAASRCDFNGTWHETPSVSFDVRGDGEIISLLGSY